MKTIKLESIRIDGGTQSRVELNQEYVSELAEAMQANTDVPPVIVFFDGSTNWLADGFHRYFASKKAGFKEINADVRKGTQEDAILFAVGANAQHGLRRTNADKRKSVEMLLALPKWKTASSRDVAEQCGVSNFLANEIIKRLLESNSRTVVGRDGRSYNTTNLSTNKPSSSHEVTNDFDLSEDDIEESEPINTQAEQPVIKDRLGHVISDLKIVSAFNRSSELETLSRQVTDIKSVISRAVDSKDELFARVSSSMVLSSLDKAASNIRHSRPHSVCPYCQHAGNDSCKACNGTGWLTKLQWDCVPAEIQETLK